MIYWPSGSVAIGNVYFLVDDIIFSIIIVASTATTTTNTADAAPRMVAVRWRHHNRLRVKRHDIVALAAHRDQVGLLQRHLCGMIR